MGWVKERPRPIGNPPTKRVRSSDLTKHHYSTKIKSRSFNSGYTGSVTTNKGKEFTMGYEASKDIILPQGKNWKDMKGTFKYDTENPIQMIGYTLSENYDLLTEEEVDCLEEALRLYQKETKILIKPIGDKKVEKIEKIELEDILYTNFSQLIPYTFKSVKIKLLKWLRNVFR